MSKPELEALRTVATGQVTEVLGQMRELVGRKVVIEGTHVGDIALHELLLA